MALQGAVSVVAPRLYSYHVVASYPHDPECFSQGLAYAPAEGVFYESCGLYRRSDVRRVETATGRVLSRVANGDKEFAEGLALAPKGDGDAEQAAVYQLLWHTNRVHSYELQTLAPIAAELRTPMVGDRRKKDGSLVGTGDGWGLAFDGTHLIGSDASSTLYFLEPGTMREVRRVTVTDEGRPVKWLNELEVVRGELWANIWQRDCIARVDLASGAVLGWVLLNNLRQQAAAHMPQGKRMDVLNGIAFDASEGDGKLYLTGKNWPRLFEVEVQAVQASGPADLESARRHCIVPTEVTTP